MWEPPRLAIINLQKKKKRHCKTFKPHLNQREEMVREGFFRGNDFYIHLIQNASIITTKDRKPLSPAASRLHWMHMASDKPILPVVTASVSTTTNASPVPSAPSETQADTLSLGFESSDLPLTPPATDLPSRGLASSPSLASPVKRILQLDEEQDVSSRLEEVRAVPALFLPRHPATVLTPVRKSCQNSSRPWIGWRRAGDH